MNIRLLPPLLALVLASGPGSAAPRTITLDVQNMTCPVCPLTVRKALEQVSGVQQVTFDYESKTATVQFDDATATPGRLTEATAAAGYPSTVRSEGK
jgi:mercuric ion binding protein